MNDAQSETEIDQGLILLKCHGCKTPTLFRLLIRPEAERKYTANKYCARCEQEDNFRRMWRQSLAPALVENQRIDSGPEGFCHEADRGDSGA